MIYNIIVEEYIVDTFEINASSQEEALENAQEMYRNCEIVLEPGHLLDVNFSAYED